MDFLLEQAQNILNNGVNQEIIIDSISFFEEWKRGDDCLEMCTQIIVNSKDKNMRLFFLSIVNWNIVYYWENRNQDEKLMIRDLLIEINDQSSFEILARIGLKEWYSTWPEYFSFLTSRMDLKGFNYMLNELNRYQYVSNSDKNRIRKLLSEQSENIIEFVLDSGFLVEESVQALVLVSDFFPYDCLISEKVFSYLKNNMEINISSIPLLVKYYKSITLFREEFHENVIIITQSLYDVLLPNIHAHIKVRKFFSMFLAKHIQYLENNVFDVISVQSIITFISQTNGESFWDSFLVLEPVLNYEPILSRSFLESVFPSFYSNIQNGFEQNGLLKSNVEQIFNSIVSWIPDFCFNYFLSKEVDSEYFLSLFCCCTSFSYDQVLHLLSRYSGDNKNLVKQYVLCLSKICAFSSEIDIFTEFYNVTYFMLQNPEYDSLFFAISGLKFYFLNTQCEFTLENQLCCFVLDQLRSISIGDCIHQLVQDFFVVGSLLINKMSLIEEKIQTMGNIFGPFFKFFYENSYYIYNIDDQQFSLFVSMLKILRSFVESCIDFSFYNFNTFVIFPVSLLELSDNDNEKENLIVKESYELLLSLVMHTKMTFSEFKPVFYQVIDIAVEKPVFCSYAIEFLCGLFNFSNETQLHFLRFYESLILPCLTSINSGTTAALSILLQSSFWMLNVPFPIDTLQNGLLSLPLHQIDTIPNFIIFICENCSDDIITEIFQPHGESLLRLIISMITNDSFHRFFKLEIRALQLFSLSCRNTGFLNDDFFNMMDNIIKDQIPDIDERILGDFIRNFACFIDDYQLVYSSIRDILILSKCCVSRDTKYK